MSSSKNLKTLLGDKSIESDGKLNSQELGGGGCSHRHLGHWT
ncbi:MAG: hypothetical protein V7L20_04575 [Nostoc sp.]